jgi:lactoylglutathione lyase
MLRITDPEKSIKYYTENFGMTLVDKFDFPQYSFSLYFLTTIPEGETYTLIPGTQEAHDYLWSMDGVALELTHNYNPQQKYHPGNQERDGFGHIAFNVEDVYDATDRLLHAGVQFKKKPDEGRMKGLAFAYDPGKGSTLVAYPACILYLMHPVKVAQMFYIQCYFCFVYLFQFIIHFSNTTMHRRVLG